MDSTAEGAGRGKVDAKEKKKLLGIRKKLGKKGFLGINIYRLLCHIPPVGKRGMAYSGIMAAIRNTLYHPKLSWRAWQREKHSWI